MTSVGRIAQTQHPVYGTIRLGGAGSPNYVILFGVWYHRTPTAVVVHYADVLAPSDEIKEVHLPDGRRNKGILKRLKTS